MAFALPQGDEKAKTLMLNAEKAYAAISDYSAAVNYSLSNPNLENPIVKKGTVQISGQKYFIDFGMEIQVCDGKYWWFIDKRNMEITKTDNEPENEVFVKKVFTDCKNNKTSIFYIGKDGLDEKLMYSIDGFSDDYKVQVWLNKAWFITRVSFYEDNKSISDFQLSDIKTNTGIAPSLFEVNINEKKYEEYYFTDLSE